MRTPDGGGKGKKSHHPNPPAFRSEWVMWVGNVPSDSTHDELWQFFTRPEEVADQNDRGEGTSGGKPGAGIFLISRSSCAFVNLASEEQLDAAIFSFNGLSLRPHDPRVPKLVCRVRRREDDMRAGVGGQRGIGLHAKWLKEQQAMTRQDAAEPQRPRTISATSDTTTDDTNSSFLERYFPKRYFILKSLTQYDLDLSVTKGLWATQKHNEGVLDKAFRTSHDVYLIFGVNKSGEFYGCARPAGEWGESFRIEWIKTERLPFHRTKHLRNPWNHDREVKVSRDGTELEPTVGEALLREWDRFSAEVAGKQPAADGEGPSEGGGGGGGGGGRRRRGRGTND
ncbi:YT521-B-like domain-containing protein [Pterulicium gracile]|uniref:YT521-B-like domain-containing protein n=1 Tax=Pterulicium gracile TaxID=1884261 RepID=A0A5C3Q7P7_9AGAR|nr:YT521-B-like domain-containing protein [Pterula gracilis]